MAPDVVAAAGPALDWFFASLPANAIRGSLGLRQA